MKLKQTFFGKQLKKILFEKNLSQQDLADKLCVGQQMISFWITGRRTPTVESISKVSTALNIPINYFIENAGYVEIVNKTTLDEKDIKILQLEKEILNLKLQIEKLTHNKNISELREDISVFNKETNKFSDLAKKKLKEYIEIFKKSKKTGKAEDKKLIDFLGNEYKGYKDICAINKLLETGEGYVPDAFERDYFGKITLLWGYEFKGGLAHIIKRRISKMSIEELEKFLKIIPDIIKTGKIRFNTDTERYEFSKNKKIVVIDILTEDSGIKFLLTGFREGE